MNFAFDRIRQNLRSGLTVSLISIPLSVSLAVASNATPLIGIITAIWAGLIAAIFGGSNFNIIGPTGALSGVIATYVLVNGITTLPMLAITTGVLILLAYIFKLERFLILIPSSVIHGFTLGVAFIIGLNQFNSALGLSGLKGHETFFANLIESFRNIALISWPTFLIFAAFLAVLFILKKFVRSIPGAIILAPVGIILGMLGENGTIPLDLITLGNRFGDISFSFFVMPTFSFTPALIKGSLVVALIAILETMLSAKIADGMTKTKHHERREMLGLALANVGSGLMGGMPATAALARTALNVKTGATHKTSAGISIFFVALISIFFLSYFKYIPMAVIAAILVYVAIQMVELHHFARFLKYERTGFWVAFIVALVTVVEDPIYGILLGAVISLLIFVNRLSHGYFDLRLNSFKEGMIGAVSTGTECEIKDEADAVIYSIKGKLCYINSRAHINRFEGNMGRYKTVVLRLKEVFFMDIDGVEALDEIVGLLEARGQKTIITGIDDSIVGLIEQSSVYYPKLKSAGLIFPKVTNALAYLGIKQQEIPGVND